MSFAERSRAKRYSVAILSSLAAAAVELPLKPVFGGKVPLLFFLLASVISAAYGGIGPGLVSTAISAVIIIAFFELQIFLFFPFIHSSIAVFVLLGMMVSWALGRLQKNTVSLRSVKERLEIANQKLEERSTALVAANEELQRFAYALAHDLNAPLRGISALTDLLLERNEGKFDESSGECAEMIVTKVRGMQSMIQGLLDYAAAVEKPEERKIVDCDAVVERAVSDLDSTIRDSDAEITVAPLPSVRANENHLVQVFSNLIGNAIKYRSAVRRPQIHISAKERPYDWVFCVSDNGIGLDMKHAEEIFGMFRRLHGEGQYEGSGIGLALCRIVVQRHGGRIWVESEVEKGSRFYFTLPKNAASPALVPAASSASFPQR